MNANKDFLQHMDSVHRASAGTDRQVFGAGIEPPVGSENSPSLSRVAICSVGELFGGVERHILGILDGLQAKGVVTVLLLFHGGELATQARQQGIETIILPNSNRSLLASSRKLARILEQRHIRILHVHGYKATVFSALARHWYSFAMVKTQHGLPEPQAGRRKRALFAGFYSLLDSATTRIAGATVCYVTEELLEHYRQAHAGLRTTVIPNGVAIMDRRHLQRPPEFCEDCFILTIVGRLAPVKGHHLAIKAIASKDLSPNLHLYIIGMGPCEAKLKALAKELGVAHRVHFLGFRRNIYDYIAYSDGLLMPSLHEGLPYTLLETMALGTPIIASRVGGLAEVLQHGVTALLVSSGDTTALAQAIGRLYGDPELHRRLSENARHLQQAQYSLEAMTKRYLDVYREVLFATGFPS
jgi:glycosyltransferase involved in cell wall biosynthesis